MYVAAILLFVMYRQHKGELRGINPLWIVEVVLMGVLYQIAFLFFVFAPFGEMFEIPLPLVMDIAVIASAPFFVFRYLQMVRVHAESPRRESSLSEFLLFWAKDAVLVVVVAFLVMALAINLLEKTVLKLIDTIRSSGH